MDREKNFMYESGDGDENAVVVFVRDREVKDGERWVASSLSSEEVQKLYTFLQETLK
jgi:hypothetical protein